MDIKAVIRAVLDILDQHDEEQQQPDVVVSGEPEEVSRFRQIYALLDKGDNPSPIANAPNEQYADVDAVTTLAGGGVNGPKHPHDIRVKDPSMYPNQQEY